MRNQIVSGKRTPRMGPFPPLLPLSDSLFSISLRRTLLPVPVSAVVSVLERVTVFVSVQQKCAREALPVWSIPCNNVT